MNFIKKLRPFDYLILVIIIAVLTVGALTFSGKRATSSNQIEATTDIDIEIYLRGVTSTSNEPVFKSGEETFITIRNVPYAKLKIKDVKFEKRQAMLPTINPKKPYILVNDETTPYQDDWEMIVWRINECYPIDGSSSEMERYQGFSEQIDSLLSYSIGSQWDANVQAWLAAQLYHYKVEIYNNRLLDCSNSFKKLFVSEQCVWKEYEKALHDICDKIIVGKNGGSASPMIYSGLFIESYEQRLISLLDCYFTLKDFDYRSTEKHKLISDNMIHRAYSDFFHRLTDSDYEDYSADEKRNALRNDMRFWNKWMAERVQLPMPLKEVYDNCTNNLKRRKLIQLKNFYDGYGLTTSFTQELILHPDCSDEELFNYDYQKRYELMMTR